MDIKQILLSLKCYFHATNKQSSHRQNICLVLFTSEFHEISVFQDVQSLSGHSVQRGDSKVCSGAPGSNVFQQQCKECSFERTSMDMYGQILAFMQ